MKTTEEWDEEYERNIHIDLPGQRRSAPIAPYRERIRNLEEEYAKLWQMYGDVEAQRDRLKDALESYADPINWGYYDESGCAKGEGKYEDACFIGPAIAREALTQGGQDD